MNAHLFQGTSIRVIAQFAQHYNSGKSLETLFGLLLDLTACETLQRSRSLSTVRLWQKGQLGTLRHRQSKHLRLEQSDRSSLSLLRSQRPHLHSRSTKDNRNLLITQWRISQFRENFHWLLDFGPFVNSFVLCISRIASGRPASWATSRAFSKSTTNYSTTGTFFGPPTWMSCSTIIFCHSSVSEFIADYQDASFRITLHVQYRNIISTIFRTIVCYIVTIPKLSLHRRYLSLRISTFPIIANCTDRLRNVPNIHNKQSRLWWRCIITRVVTYWFSNLEDLSNGEKYQQYQVQEDHQRTAGTKFFYFEKY